MDEMKITVTGHQVYKAITNYLHNEMQMSRDEVIKMIDDRLDRIVKVHLEEKMKGNNFEKLFRQAIVEVIKNGLNISMYSTPAPFDETLAQMMKAILKEEMAERFVFSVENKQK